MNECYRPYYLQPYVWFLIMTAILFIIFVGVIEFDTNHFNTNEAFPEWIIILFFVIVVFLFISFIMYYWFKNKCNNKIVQPAILEDTYIDCHIEDQFIYVCDNI